MFTSLYVIIHKVIIICKFCIYMLWLSHCEKVNG